ncbi:hypothetical protein BH11VER1_BH11VER1_26790 [soil metagenome]
MPLHLRHLPKIDPFKRSNKAHAKSLKTHEEDREMTHPVYLMLVDFGTITKISSQPSFAPSLNSHQMPDEAFARS